MTSPICPTHEWLSFRFPLDKLGSDTWVQLGRLTALIEQVQQTPIKPSMAQRFMSVHLAKGVLATNAIEGNTLTEKQVRQILDDELHLPPFQAYLQQEIENVVDACNGLAADLESGDVLLSEQLIKDFNSQVLRKLPTVDGQLVGDYRVQGVGVGRYLAPGQRHVPPLMRRFVEVFGLTAADNPPLEQTILAAVFLHLYFVWIHPFDDGNGRTARLLEFYFLSRAGVPAPCCHLLSNHYNKTRTMYYRRLDEASTTHNPITFVEYAVQGFADGLAEQAVELQRETMNVAWESLVFELIGGPGEMLSRRRRILLELSHHHQDGETDDTAFIPQRLIPSLSLVAASLYPKGKEKTLSRDMNALEKEGLVERSGTRSRPSWRARKDTLRRFLPNRAKRL